MKQHEKEGFIKLATIMIPRRFNYVESVEEIDIESMFVWHFRLRLKKKFVEEHASDSYLRWLKRKSGLAMSQSDIDKGHLGGEINVKQITEFISDLMIMLNLYRTEAFDIKFFY